MVLGERTLEPAAGLNSETTDKVGRNVLVISILIEVSVSGASSDLREMVEGRMISELKSSSGEVDILTMIPSKKQERKIGADLVNRRIETASKEIK